MVNEDDTMLSKCSCSGSCSSVGTVWMSISTVICGGGTGRAFVWTLNEALRGLRSGLVCIPWLTAKSVGSYCVEPSEYSLSSSKAFLVELHDGRSTWYFIQT